MARERLGVELLWRKACLTDDESVRPREARQGERESEREREKRTVRKKLRGAAEFNNKSRWIRVT